MQRFDSKPGVPFPIKEQLENTVWNRVAKEFNIMGHVLSIVGSNNPLRHIEMFSRTVAPGESFNICGLEIDPFKYDLIKKELSREIANPLGLLIEDRQKGGWVRCFTKQRTTIKLGDACNVSDTIVKKYRIIDLDLMLTYNDSTADWKSLLERQARLCPPNFYKVFNICFILARYVNSKGEICSQFENAVRKKLGYKTRIEPELGAKKLYRDYEYDKMTGKWKTWFCWELQTMFDASERIRGLYAYYYNDGRGIYFNFTLVYK